MCALPINQLHKREYYNSNGLESTAIHTLPTIPFKVTDFNECLADLILIPTATKFHRAILMLNSAFIHRRLNYQRIWLTPVGDLEQLTPLRPFVKRLSKVYFDTVSLGILYEIEDTKTLKNFDDILQLEPDCCDTLVMRIYNWIINRKYD